MFFRNHRQNNRPAAVSHGWNWVVSMTKNVGPTMELGMLSYIMERGKRFGLGLDMMPLLCKYGRPWERLRPGAGKRFVALPYRSQKISSCDACPRCMSAENLTSKSPICNTGSWNLAVVLVGPLRFLFVSHVSLDNLSLTFQRLNRSYFTCSSVKVKSKEEGTASVVNFD